MNTIIVSTFILIINFTDLIYANPQHRREPVGFQGTRGRRSIEFPKKPNWHDDNYSIHNQKNDNEALNHDSGVDKHVGDPAFDVQPSMESITSTSASLAPRTIVKRAPMGFQGMRGKKDNELFSDLEKRYPTGFQGVRGKKLLLNFPHRYSYYSPKRAPSGFMGMRGKKDYLDPEVFNYLTNEDDQKLYQALLNSNLLNRLYDNQMQLDDDVSAPDDDDEKRVSNFELMEAISDIDQTLAYEKRAPYGFVGMRGKRAPVGFMGMRGKKDDFDGEYLSSLDDKRGPLAGFFGTRGKKQPFNSGFFGTRGKKYPYSLGSKFIGVRGKKDSLGDMESNMIDDVENPMIKRKPSGFMGMRGKKDSDTINSNEE